MTKIRAKISGIHGYVPSYVLTNQELESMVDTSDEWIVTRTGIHERHIQKGKGLGTSDMGAEAVRGLLEKTGTRPEEIGLLICATVTPDMLFPATATIICDKTGIKNAFSYDVEAACLRAEDIRAFAGVELGLQQVRVLVGRNDLVVDLNARFLGKLFRQREFRVLHPVLARHER